MNAIYNCCPSRIILLVGVGAIHRSRRRTAGREAVGETGLHGKAMGLGDGAAAETGDGMAKGRWKRERKERGRPCCCKWMLNLDTKHASVKVLDFWVNLGLIC